jgi:endosialidase-like protein
MNPLIQSKKSTLLFVIAVLLACFALLPTVRAVTPPPDGGYLNAVTAEGEDALFNLSPNPVFSQDTTAIGFHALFSATSSFFDTAVGSQALASSTGGEANTAVGYKALTGNTGGAFNTAVGQQALASNTTAFSNTAIGTGALFGNTTGGENTASGADALENNTTGSANMAAGGETLFNNTTGDNNTASGFVSLFHNRTGNNNTADGTRALFHNKSGDANTAVGFLALSSNRKGNNNIALGALAGGSLTTGDNNIDIGNAGVTGESAKIRIGTTGAQNNTFIAGISGVTVAGGVGVVIDSNGQLGTTTSSAHFKQDIQAMGEASNALLALKPVTFRYKHQIDPEGIPQFGLVAEEVEKVNPALVARDAKGEVYTVRYEAVNAMLLNEFLKEHRKVEQLTKDFESKLAQQQKQIEALTEGLRKVSAQLEASGAAPQMVVNDQ